MDITKLTNQSWYWVYQIGDWEIAQWNEWDEIFRFCDGCYCSSSDVDEIDYNGIKR